MDLLLIFLNRFLSFIVTSFYLAILNLWISSPLLSPLALYLLLHKYHSALSTYVLFTHIAPSPFSPNFPPPYRYACLLHLLIPSVPLFLFIFKFCIVLLIPSGVGGVSSSSPYHTLFPLSTILPLSIFSPKLKR